MNQFTHTGVPPLHKLHTDTTNRRSSITHAPATHNLHFYSNSSYNILMWCPKIKHLFSWPPHTLHTHTAVSSRCAACILNYSNLQIVLMENWQHYLEAICFPKILSIFICHCRILTRIHRVWWGMAARYQTFTNTMHSSFHIRNFFSPFTLLWHPQHQHLTSRHILFRLLYSGRECVKVQSP